MKDSAKKLRTILIAGGMIATLASCDPAKRVQKYSYLLDDNPKEMTTTKEEDHKVEIAESTGAIIASKEIKKVIKEAESYMGTKYKYGGTTRKGLDCSALTQNAYSTIGVSLPRSSSDQSKVGKKVSRKKVQPGDLVFFSAKSNGRVDHVGMIVEVKGEDVNFIHASTSKGVRVDALNTGYWKSRVISVKRVAK